MLKLVSGQEIYTEVFEKGIREARNSVWIATANVKNAAVLTGAKSSGPFLDMFETLLARGVEIRLLHSGVPSERFLMELRGRPELVRSPLFGMKKCVRSHFKCVLVDGRMMYVGSANLTGAGMGMKSERKRNFELGVISDEDRLMDETAAFFDSIWHGEFCGSCRRTKDCPVPLESPEF